MIQRIFGGVIYRDTWGLQFQKHSNNTLVLGRTVSCAAGPSPGERSRKLSEGFRMWSPGCRVSGGVVFLRAYRARLELM